MALETYRRKRDFSRTAEPQGGESASDGHAYLIQKHAARRLHYDLRLELDGVLKSWAVTRGPSLVPGEKRLAVHVEDHPLDYGTFEGTIPKGQYGGGTVLLWDTGSWEPIGDPHKGYAKGHLEFELAGRKLRGRWHLVRMAKRRGETADNWLLIKGEDEEARDASAPDVLEAEPDSVKTGRTLDEITASAAPRMPGGTKARGASSAKPKRQPADRASAPLPAFVEPELATLVAKAPTGKNWIHEIKFDGYRIEARINNNAQGKGRVRLFTRSGLDWTGRFGPSLVEALANLPIQSALIDGELVVETPQGASSFTLLQQDLAADRHDRFVYYGFDLLHRDGTDLRGEPLLARKAALATLMQDVPPLLRLSEHFEVDGATMLRHACRLSLEGLVSKKATAPYRSGRSRDWVKSKCSDRQEFVIGGFVTSTAMPKAIGSLVLGVHEDGRLVHVGRVGTGFSQAAARDLYARLSEMTRARNPFAGALTADERRGVSFVAPQLVAEVEFRGWTGDRHLRHAAFRGLREDKPAREIVRETAAVTAPSMSRIKLTHPERVYWPEDGITKHDLAEYCATIWPRIAPFVVARPLALLRCPDGIAQACFFQKHSWRGMNKALKVRRDTEGSEMLAIDDLDGLIALVQAGSLEIHPWGSTLADIEEPDTLVFDLDPGEGVNWHAMVAGARNVKSRLESEGLPAFVKTSGGKGLHVVVPLRPHAGWDDAKAFAKGIAEAMAADDAKRFIAAATKARRKGRIFVDYLRNGRGATAITAYGTRARPGAAVSMPVAWDELDSLTGAADFTLANAPARVSAQKRDPWEDFRHAAVPLATKAPRRKR
ncbi:DNA ligase D [Ancylobacter sonchi]|uniref:DNA ligase D n=1 Tax=Ancylobacter sonchi TaxID=1937790 RepID=UPI001BD64253|nr:DNA ligase D [Ancylobacter sonchi]MBS7533384.1 DNA ligase D [Ancylobacter sonchi]